MWFEGDFALYCIEREPVCMHWVEIKHKGDLAHRGARYVQTSRGEPHPSEGNLTPVRGTVVVSVISDTAT